MTRSSRQLPLDLGHRPALNREDFLVSESNREAVALVDRWPDWPQHAAALYGPPGSGKSHLAQVWRIASDAVAPSHRDLLTNEPPDLLSGARACLIEDLDSVPEGAASRELERNLLHLFNLLREIGGYLLFTGRRPPARWPIALPDLSSRLAAMPAVPLGPPDDTLIEAVLVKLLADRQLRVSPEVVRYIAGRMERSFAAARRLVAALDELALSERREITVPLARRVVEMNTDTRE